MAEFQQYNPEIQFKNDSLGASPEIDPQTLESSTEVISTPEQAFEVADKLVDDAEKLIKNAASITKILNGAPPFSRKDLKNKGKGYKSNISTGALATAINKIPPRFYMPLKNARYLTAASLPAGHPGGVEKTEFFRETVTKSIRKWKKWHFFTQGLTTELARYGFVFAAFFDEYEWRPTLIRMDRGFVPVGTEILDNDIAFFRANWQYNPSDLLSIVRKSVDAGLSDWNIPNVVSAINAATAPTTSREKSDLRTYEDLIRQASSQLSYTKGCRKIEAFHLFALEADGTVSHWILNSGETEPKAPDGETSKANRVLYKRTSRFKSMQDVVNAFVFEYGNGTIHGSLGAGHILFDMATELEKTRNDSFDNLRNTNKIKLQVPDAKDINQVKTTVTDEKIIVSGAQFAGVTASMPTAVEGYIALDQQQRLLMEERIGVYLPPVPLGGTNPTATQVNVQQQKEAEISNANTDNFLSQVEPMIISMARRLCSPGNPDPIAKETLTKLLEKLSPKELALILSDASSETIAAFTEFQNQRIAQYCATVRNNSKYDQAALERVISNAMVGETVTQAILPPSYDQSVMAEATRLQLMENSAMESGKTMPVSPNDNDAVHMEVLKPDIMQGLENPQPQPQEIAVLELKVAHYGQHYQSAVGKKSLPKDQINQEKAFVRSIQEAVQSAKMKVAQAQRLAAITQAQQAVASGGIPQEQQAEMLQQLPEPTA
jgi:hypothetical protein